MRSISLVFFDSFFSIKDTAMSMTTMCGVIRGRRPLRGRATERTETARISTRTPSSAQRELRLLAIDTTV